MSEKLVVIPRGLETKIILVERERSGGVVSHTFIQSISNQPQLSVINGGKTGEREKADDRTTERRRIERDVPSNPSRKEERETIGRERVIDAA